LVWLSALLQALRLGHIFHATNPSPDTPATVSALPRIRFVLFVALAVVPPRVIAV
jgi:hypothetical protein